ncbi:universal stress protein [Streptomyces zingiberis]|uniref:Universal stress protein n=1 Tax=Streptomyces zingiberis TaxID=2053010 RepID=A0ABX1C4E2_9ACTN|nr:universal stress protein [Streptomyces zingiberis]NJQ03515.1 universal stress protein [Streptomyces zingiberis]
MNSTVTAALDDSPEAAAAGEWAAGEAWLRGVELRLVHVRPKESKALQAPFRATGTRHPTGARHRSAGGLPEEVVAGLRDRHPEVKITADELTGSPADILQGIAHTADLLVLGSRGLGGVRGFLVGSVALATLAHATHPAVLVRAGPEEPERAEPPGPRGEAGDGRRATASAREGPGEVVVGVDLAQPCDEVIRFAFEEARRRGAVLRAVHAYRLPPAETWATPPAVGAYPPFDIAPDAGEITRYEASALSALLGRRRAEFPGVEVAEEAEVGSAAHHLLQAADGASLVVLGRRIRRAPLSPRIGSVAHALLHHARAPVAVVPHS